MPWLPDGEMIHRRLLKASRASAGLWLDASKWWIQTMADGAAVWREENLRLLGQAAEALAKAIVGHSLETDFGGLPLRATVESLSLDAAHPGRARLELSGADWGGLVIQRLAIVADGVVIAPLPSMRVTVTGLELEGEILLKDLVAWADSRLRGWRLGLRPDGLVEAARAGGPLTIVLAPVIRRNEIELELRRLRWRGVEVGVPGRFRLTRRLPFPALPHGASLTEVRHDENAVEFVMVLPDVTRQLDLAQALARAQRRLIPASPPRDHP